MQPITTEQAQQIAQLKRSAGPAAVMTTAGTGITVWGLSISEWVSIGAGILTALQIMKFLIDNRKGIRIIFKLIWEKLTWHVF